MLKLWTALAFLATFAVVGLFLVLGREEIFMNGPLQPGHDYLGKRRAETGERYCSSCHVPVLGARDSAMCMECHHALAADVRAPVAEAACLTCHLEHSRRRDPLVPRSEGACLDCHPDAEHLHRNLYMQENEIPLETCMESSCHGSPGYHPLHRVPAPRANYATFHDLEDPAYDESHCVDCHGEVYGRPDLGGKTDIHKIHFLRMDMKCKDCHLGVDFVQDSAATLRRQVHPQVCIKCHHAWYQSDGEGHS